MPIGRPMRWPHRLEALAALDQAGDFAGLEAALARLPADPQEREFGWFAARALAFLDWGPQRATAFAYENHLV